MLAPNGRKSNLNADQYYLVRTLKFKEWFGDWENKPEDASKVVDENGEPLVVYHNSSPQKFYEFNKGTKDGLGGKGIYFSEYPLPQFGKNQMKVFLKIEKPITTKTELDGMREINSSGNKTKFIADIFEKFPQFDGQINRSEIVVINSNQIKLADGTNTTFDGGNPDIRYAEGGDIGQQIVCVNCGWGWNTNDSEDYDKYICHNCGFDNRTYYDAEPIGFKDGGRTISQTPSPKKDRIHGSKVNPKGSASSEKSAKDIYLSEKTTTALNNKLKEFKETHNTDKVSLNDLKAVYRRGLGAYSSSHRPTITGGVPNTRNAWAMARVNAFLRKAGGGEHKKAYVQDDDLLKYADGGEVHQLINDGIVELKMYDSNNEHSKIYGFDAEKPLYIQSINISKEHRNKGIGSKVMKYIVEHAKNNGNDLIIGHITQKAEPNIDVIKSMLLKSGFKTIDGNNDFYKIINNDDSNYADGGEVDDKKKTYDKWKSLVNMSYSELEKFYNSEDGKKAGLSSSEAKKQGIDSGRESARMILKMKSTPKSNWTDTMWKWAKKQISFISRMSGMKGDLYDDKGNKTRKHTSLLIWGHNPKRYDYGGELEKLGLSEQEVTNWENEHKVSQRQEQNKNVLESAQKLSKGEISQDEYIKSVRENLPIKPFTEVPQIPTLLEIVGALKSNQVETGIIGFTKFIKDGEQVATRLDIPAYNNYDTWIVSVHDAKEKHAIGYGQTAYLKDITFLTSPKVALNIATNRSDKTTFARMKGSWINKHPQEVREMAVKYMNDKNWVQVGMNPYRHSWFYDKSDGMPLLSAEEVIQVGALVLAKNPVKTTPDNEAFIVNKDKPNIKFKDGGLFKSHKSIEQIAKEKNVPLVYAKNQLMKGMKTESEHSNSKKVQKTIALQHLDEMMNYYTKLKTIEK